MIAEKKLGVKYIELTCKSCKTPFHAELGAARMAPGAERVVLDSETPFTELSTPFAKRLLDYNKGTPPEMRQRAAELHGMVESEPGLKCPKCSEFAGQFLRDVLGKHAGATRRAEIDKKHLGIKPPRNATKHVYCYLLIDSDWLKGAPGFNSGTELGGYAEATLEATSRWYNERLANLTLIEVRGRIKLTDDTTHLGVAEEAPVPQSDEETANEEQADEAEESDQQRVWATSIHNPSRWTTY